MPRKTGVYQTAPDGGPTVPSGWKPKGVRRVATIQVRRKYAPESRLVNIRADQFDPEVHEKVGENTLTKSRRPRVHLEDPPPAMSHDQLASMTVDALKSLPEWEHVENKSTLTTKGLIVEAIMALRTEGGG